MKLRQVRVSPSFFSEAEAAAALRALCGRLDDPLVEKLVEHIWWLARPTILPGWRWP